MAGMCQSIHGTPARFIGYLVYFTEILGYSGAGASRTTRFHGHYTRNRHYPTGTKGRPSFLYIVVAVVCMYVYWCCKVQLISMWRRPCKVPAMPGGFAGTIPEIGTNKTVR